MGNIETFVTRMRYWCDDANLGYDQGQRRSIVVGGECDCSSLVIHAAQEAGFSTGGATYTGNMRAAFAANGWQVLSPGTTLVAGDILLNDYNHVAVYVGGGLLSEAAIDERGQIVGGQSGDQTGNETRTRSYYDYPWKCVLRYGGVGAPSSTYPYNPGGYGWEYVTVVQRLLQAAGSKYEAMLRPDGADGVLGEKTFAAIKEFQKDQGLMVDGIPGPRTLQALRAASQPLSRIAVDGDWGPMTAARFREVMGVPRTSAWPPACKKFQQFLNSVVDAPHIIVLTGDKQLAVDGIDGRKTYLVFQWWANNRWPGTVKNCGGLEITGKFDKQTCKVIQALLNASTAGTGRLGK